MVETITVSRAEMRGARVLLVDDSDIVRDVNRSLLEDAGIVVEEAGDGAAALAMMRENGARCQLILMDVQMPVLDGISATRAIRAALGEQAPPIIALTAQAAEGEKRACREAGMCDHLSKPVDPLELIGAMNRWLTPLACDAALAPEAHSKTPEYGEDQQALPAVPGFHLDAGLRCVGGKTALLRSQLVRFGASYADVALQLRQLMQAQAYGEARRVAHTLKGAAATLGGAAIANSAGRVEQWMLQRAEAGASAAGGAPAAQIDSAIAELADALQRAMPALRAMAAAQPDAAPTRVTALSAELPPAQAAEYQALRQLLADNCYAARKAFAALRDRLGADDAQWRAAAAAVDALDFARALAYLDARYPASVSKR